MLYKIILVTTAIVTLAGTGLAQGLADVNNQADINHPNIHDKVGDGTNANPNGKTRDGGGIHGIGNVPGKSGADPSNGRPGFADQLETVHGGIGDRNKNAN